MANALLEQILGRVVFWNCERVRNVRATVVVDVLRREFIMGERKERGGWVLW